MIAFSSCAIGSRGNGDRPAAGAHALQAQVPPGQHSRLDPRLRRLAHDRGITSWDDPRASSDTLGIGTAEKAVKCDAVLEANRRRFEEKWGVKWERHRARQA